MGYHEIHVKAPIEGVVDIQAVVGGKKIKGKWMAKRGKGITVILGHQPWCDIAHSHVIEKSGIFVPVFGVFTSFGLDSSRIAFTMPNDDVMIKVKLDAEGRTRMEEKIKNSVIEMVPIPEELAKELSELLVKQTIRERVLVQLVGQPEKYEEAEKMLAPVVAKVEAIKVKITREYIPAKFNDPRYVWNFNGYEIDGAAVEIIKQ